jgi:hypothetical protein
MHQIKSHADSACDCALLTQKSCKR